ncbi:hypothetical protein [Henriciella sp.]|uniref:hypothetical protein n=1 Tax=Henriciella sp. TaxID=1968823 RepID=UPI00262F2DC7|nr:hypothetical protein [Henriciella sp.]
MPLSPARLLSAMLALWAFLPGAFAQTLDIQPTSVEIPAEPGMRHRQVLSITNMSAEETRSLTIGLADWTLTGSGQLSLSPPGEADRSAASWARFTPGFLSLEPGQSGNVILDMIVPAKPDHGGDYLFALMASEVSPGPNGQMRKIEASSLFYLTIAPAVSDPAITDVRMASPTRLDIEVSNAGNAHARLDGEVRIEAASGETTSLPISNLVVLETSDRTFTLPLAEGVTEGARVTVTLDNVFAPQSGTGVEALRTWSGPLEAPAG